MFWTSYLWLPEEHQLGILPNELYFKVTSKDWKILENEAIDIFLTI